MQLVMELSHEDLSSLCLGVIIEGWNRRLYGHVQRAWLVEFSDEERKKAESLYDTFYRWTMITGLPQRYVLRSAQELHFIKRLVNFFGGV